MASRFGFKRMVRCDSLGAVTLPGDRVLAGWEAWQPNQTGV